jgi:NAD(P)-dependent dehydrogenase (short-subunit alcohol dehydrogenase family)
VALRSRASDRLTPIFLDITDTASISSAVDAVAAAVGGAGLCGLVNNAGIVVAGPLEFLAVAEIRQQFEVNVIGHVAVTQSFLPLLRQGRGRIINIGSTGGRVAMPYIGAYNASKFAMEALTDSLRVELSPWRIYVSLIEPNFIATPIWEKSKVRADGILKDLPPEASLLYGKRLVRVRDLYSKVGEMGTPAEEVAQAVFQALTTSKPKPRYLVGKGAWFATAIFACFPDRLRDFLIARWLLKWST